MARNIPPRLVAVPLRIAVRFLVYRVSFSLFYSVFFAPEYDNFVTEKDLEHFVFNFSVQVTL